MIKSAWETLTMQSYEVSFFRKVRLLLSIMLLAAIVYLQYRGLLEFIDSRYLRVIVVFLASFSIFNIIRFSIVTSYRKRNKVPVGERDNFTIGMDSIVWLLVFFVTLGSVFPIFSIPLSSFLTSLSLFSVASAWVFKDYLTNFIDGYRLMFSKDFLIGNYIRLGEQTKGVITDITFRATKLKTDSGDVLYIPNTTILNSEVVNLSKAKYKRIIVPFSVSLDGVRDVLKFEAYLKETLLKEFPDLVDPQNVFLRILNIEHTDTDFALEISVDTYTFAIEDRINRAVFEAVLAHPHSS